VVGAFIEPG